MEKKIFTGYDFGTGRSKPVIFAGCMLERWMVNVIDGFRECRQRMEAIGRRFDRDKFRSTLKKINDAEKALREHLEVISKPKENFYIESWPKPGSPKPHWLKLKSQQSKQASINQKPRDKLFANIRDKKQIERQRRNEPRRVYRSN